MSEFRNLNIGGTWPGFTLDGLERDGEFLRLVPSRVGDPAGGTFVSPPVVLADGPTSWGRVRASVEADGAVPTGSAQLYVCATDNTSPPPVPARGEGDSGSSPTTLGRWRAAPVGAMDLLAAIEPAPQLWVGGRLTSRDAPGPQVAQLRVDAADDTWLERLPGVFRRVEDPDRFLPRLLALLEAQLGEVESRLASVPSLFDPSLAPDVTSAGVISAGGGSWLDWLAGLVAADVEESWDESRRRRAVRRALPDAGRRGTAAGLATAVERRLESPRVLVEEPGLRGSVWALDGQAGLGLGTMLPSGDIAGAIVGTTATPGSSHLVTGPDLGGPALAALSGRVTVAVPAVDLHASAARAGVPPPVLATRLSTVLDRERPAHVECHLCVIEPALRVGRQARVGIDAVVGGPPAGAPVGRTVLGVDLRAGGPEGEQP